MQNIFWEIDVIKGVSTSLQGKDMIELLSFSHGVSMPMTMGPSNVNRSSGRCTHQDFTVAKFVDMTSPTLNLKCCTGEEIKSMKIHVWATDDAGKPFEYLTDTFDGCIITSVSIGYGGGTQPVETVTFSYRKITWDYLTPVKPSGAAKSKNSTNWSIEENRMK